MCGAYRPHREISARRPSYAEGTDHRKDAHHACSGNALRPAHRRCPQPGHVAEAPSALYEAVKDVHRRRDRTRSPRSSTGWARAGPSAGATAPGQLELLDSVKAKAKANGLWNFFLPNAETGEGLSNLDYAYIAAELGKNPLASECLNCSAPDTGNMEVLERVGTPEQKKQWLEPLLAGEIRSAYAMTEPDVASSDAKNIRCQAVLDGDEWVINGEKYYISGAGDPRCKIMIVMVQTSPDAAAAPAPVADPGADGHARASRSSGPMHVFGEDDAPHGHMHLRFTDVRVPELEHPARRGPRLRDLPGAPRPGPHPPLHALDRRGRAGARADGAPRPQPRGVRQAARPPGQEHRGRSPRPASRSRPCA